MGLWKHVLFVACLVLLTVHARDEAVVGHMSDLEAEMGGADATVNEQADVQAQVQTTQASAQAQTLTQASTRIHTLTEASTQAQTQTEASTKAQTLTEASTQVQTEAKTEAEANTETQHHSPGKGPQPQHHPQTELTDAAPTPAPPSIHKTVHVPHALTPGQKFPGGNEKRTPGHEIPAGKTEADMYKPAVPPPNIPKAPPPPAPQVRKVPAVILHPKKEKEDHFPHIDPKKLKKPAMVHVPRPIDVKNGERDFDGDALGLDHKSIHNAVLAGHIPPPSVVRGHGGHVLPEPVTVNHNTASTRVGKVFLVPDPKNPPSFKDFPALPLPSNYTYPEIRRKHKHKKKKKHPHFPLVNFTIPETRLPRPPKRHHKFLNKTKHKHHYPFKWLANYTYPEIRVPLRGLHKKNKLPKRLRNLAFNYTVVPEYKSTFIPVRKGMTRHQIARRIARAKKSITHALQSDLKVDQKLKLARAEIRELRRRLRLLHRKHHDGKLPPWVVLPSHVPKAMMKRARALAKAHLEAHLKESIAATKHAEAVGVYPLKPAKPSQLSPSAGAANVQIEQLKEEIRVLERKLRIMGWVPRKPQSSAPVQLYRFRQVQEAENEAAAESETEAESEAESETEAESEAESETESELEANADSEIESENESEFEAEAASEAASEVASEAAAEAEAESEKVDETQSTVDQSEVEKIDHDLAESESFIMKLLHMSPPPQQK